MTHPQNMTQHSNTTLTLLSIIAMSILTLSTMALSIMTLSIMTLSIMTLSIMTLSILTLSILTLSMMTLGKIACNILQNDTQQNYTGSHLGKHKQLQFGIRQNDCRQKDKKATFYFKNKPNSNQWNLSKDSKTIFSEKKVFFVFAVYCLSTWDLYYKIFYGRNKLGCLPM